MNLVLGYTIQAVMWIIVAIFAYYIFYIIFYFINHFIKKVATYNISLKREKGILISLSLISSVIFVISFINNLNIHFDSIP